MKTIALTLIALNALCIAGTARADADALRRLVDGNERFAAGRSTHPEQSPTRRAEVAAGQQPFAAVVGCADSRVPPEVVLDQGLGDVFVVRTAGNVVDDVGLGSLEFAVASLGARLIVVMGHERCGAVDATLKGAAVTGHLQSVVEAIKPNIAGAASRPGDALANAVHDNVEAVVARLRGSEPVLAPRVRDGSLRIVGAVYDLDSGAVAVIDPPARR